MSAILAFDQGTTSSRAILFSHAGEILGVAQREFTQYYPKAGWVEHDANEIWESQLAVAKEVLDQSSLGIEEIAAIGITNQRETTMLWDRATGKPIANAIVWQDRRTAPFCDELIANGHVESVQKKTGLLIDAYFCGTKLRWLLDNVPGARDRAEKGELAFGTIDSWLIWNLTGGAVHATDASNASRTMMWDIATRQWDDELLELLNVPKSVLPTVHPSSHVFGESDAELLGAKLKIGGAAGDQQAALYGQNCTQHGMAKNTYGTGCFMLMNVGAKAPVSKSKLLTTVACNGSGQSEYALEGSVFVAGAAVQWLRDGLGIIKSSADVQALAESVPDTDGVYVVPALTGLGAPTWDPHARGTILGITRGTTAAHIARATLEGMAHQVADVLDAMKQDSGVEMKELRVDGGASANDMLMQFQADILGVPVVRPKIIETTALGAAYLAGLAVGYWKDEKDVAKSWQVDKTFQPNMPADEVASRRKAWAEALKRSQNWDNV